ncbi:MAG TPA: DUF763 domain-containing protein [Planctomycetaceae bacterium]|jgi:hypothetical protein|nr:DUF763 domain-containing protein [Planctomycetaceae bacterium]
MKRRLANLPLHGGKAPPWLFRRMTRLAGAVTMAIVDEFGPAEMLRRLSDPWWFQAFGCVLGFDWHSSGVTTVTCGALKEAFKLFGPDLGICVAGGKGGTSRRTPEEIAASADRFAIDDGDRLIYASRMSAKVDSAAVQDGFQLYHHVFLFTRDGQWCVVQQGLNGEQKAARRYHWLGEDVDDFVCEPHGGISDLSPDRAAPPVSPPRQLTRLNMVAGEAQSNRSASAAVICENPDWLCSQIERYTEGPTLFAPRNHRLLPHDVNRKHLRRILIAAHEKQPSSFEALLGTQGVGPATVLSLSLLAELIFDAPASHRDPAERFRLPAPTPSGERHWADYSYAHGGKDGTPFPVDRETYDRNIAILTDAVRKARIGQNEKMTALRRLTGSA